MDRLIEADARDPVAGEAGASTIEGWIDLDGTSWRFSHAGRRSTRVARSGVTVVAIGRLRYVDARGVARHELDDAASAFALDWPSEGAAALDRCDGEFAIAAFDERRHHAAIAVDRFAAQALYVARTSGRLAFGSEPKRVLGAVGRRAEVSADAVYAYCRMHMIPAPMTIWNGLERLDVAQFWVVEGRRVETRRYWQPRFEEPSPFAFEAERERFLSALRAGVAQSVEGVDPERVGCFLSGGTDSSTITGMFREVTGLAPRTFSIGFDVDGYDERRYARLAVERFGARHVEHVVSPQDALEGIETIARSYDQPFGNASAVPTLVCARLAREHGIERMLGGDGGDELFGGNERYAKQLVFERYAAAPSWVRRRLLEPLSGREAADRGPWLIRKAASYVRQARVPLPQRLHTYNTLLRIGEDAFFEPEFLRSVDTDATPVLEQAVWSETGDVSTINRLLGYDFKFTLGDNDLRKVVRMCEVAGVDVAFPMLTRPVVECSMRVPTPEKVSGSELRVFFKRALRGFLPDEIITKSKHGFGMPFGEWVLLQPGLSERVDDAMRGLAARGIIRPTLRTTIMDAVRTPHAGYYGTVAWLVTVLELWLRHHVDAR